MNANPPLVLIINSSEDLTEALGELLELEGFRWMALRQPDIDRGHVDVVALLRSARPHAIVYDVSLPYAKTAALLRKLQALPDTRGVPFVLTTPHYSAAAEFAGPGVLEILMKPFDLDRFLRAVRAATQRSVQAELGVVVKRQG